MISGPVHGSPCNREAIDTSATSVVPSFDIRWPGEEVILDHTFRSVERPFYLRLRGTDGNLSAPGSLEPLPDESGVDPWSDLWFYSNPIFVDIANYGT